MRDLRPGDDVFYKTDNPVRGCIVRVPIPAGAYEIEVIPGRRVPEPAAGSVVVDRCNRAWQSWAPRTKGTPSQWQCSALTFASRSWVELDDAFGPLTVLLDRTANA